MHKASQGTELMTACKRTPDRTKLGYGTVHRHLLSIRVPVDATNVYSCGHMKKTIIYICILKSLIVLSTIPDN